mgnify:CR=1 FL=1
MSSMIRSARLLFQSTLPARGATSVIGVPCASAVISIHAPRTGSDWKLCKSISASIYFNPRSPHGERQRRFPLCSAKAYFNPRSPHGERRGRDALARAARAISIHAPRTGSDAIRIFSDVYMHGISIHAPRTGSDCQLFNICAIRKVFQSTLPARGATISCKISLMFRRFQSTLPARGATRSKNNRNYTSCISIHAPRTGSDHAEHHEGAGRLHFNPRSPHGERPYCLLR